MKLLNLFLFLLCLVEIYAQRSRTTNNNQDVSTQEPRARGRGRSRFSVTEESLPSSERPSTNRRQPSRTRTSTSIPATPNRRGRPAEASRGYAVEETNNDSPIDSFRRQSKPRILTETQFDVPTVTVPRRQQTYQRAPSVLYASPEPPVEELGFGSTARAILQSRGEPLPQRTTTPVIDEAYLLNNFGTTFRSLAASIHDVPIQRATPLRAEVPIQRATPLRSEVPIQRATPLRSEVPILDKNDFPPRRSSLRGDPLPSLRGSDVILERQPAVRGRKTNQARVLTEQSRPSIRTTESPRANIEKDNGSILEEEITRLEEEAEGPESVQGIFEQSDIVTEAQPFESSSESLEFENEDLIKTPSSELSNQRSTELPAPRVTESYSRVNNARGRVEIENQSTSAPRTRSSRTRVSTRSEAAASTGSASRVRSSRRKYEDAEVAESRSRGPSVFTAEQYQEVTSRSRTGRRIDSRIESVPQRITIDLTPITTTTRSRNSGRRATTTASSVRDRSVSRGRGRSRGNIEEVTVSASRLPFKEKSSFANDAAFYGDKTGSSVNLQQQQQPTGRKETSHRFNTAESKPSHRESSEQVSNRRSLVRKPSASRDEVVENKREPVRRVELSEAKNSFVTRKNAPVENRRETASREELQAPRNIVSSRNSNHRQNNLQDDTIFFGEKSVRTQTNPPPTTTTAEEITTYPNVRSRSRFSNSSPKIDESKLEVLPLFERETKSKPSSSSRGHRSRSSVNRKQNTVLDHMHVSATENDVKFVEKPTTNAFTKVTVTRTQSVEASTSRTRLSTRVNTSTQSTSSTVATTKRPTSITTIRTTKLPETSVTTKKWATRAPPVIKESVVAEVNEVTSKSTFTRRQKVSKAKAAEMLSRGSKKANLKVTDTGKKTGSSEEIDEEDNYPEPFKALIQAKKKQKVDPRPSPSSAKGASASIKSTSTEKVFVTSAASPRGASAARVVTTDSPSSRRRSQFENDIVNDNENELEPKPNVISTTPSGVTRSERLRQTPEKSKYTSKPREKQIKSSTERTKFSSEKAATKTTTSSRKTYSTRKPTEHHFRRKALRSTALPPSTTPLNLINRETKFSAKFIKKESKNTALDNLEQLKSDEGSQPKSLYSSKKKIERSSREDVENAVKKLNGANTQTPKPLLPIKKFNASRYSSRYRSDISQKSSIFKTSTSAPFYTPTIPTPAYIPTVPTVTPPVTQVGEYIAEEDSDLGLEVISFDEPVNTIPSANLVNGEFLTTDKNTRHSLMVKDGTTEKAVSIIERIINSITSISTTAASNITSTTDSPPNTSNEDTGNSAILKLAPKKPTNKDKTVLDDQTKIIETITSEKPTTIIEKIRSSLSAIQSNEVDSNRMARLLANEQTSGTFSPKSVVSSTTTSSIPQSTSVVSSTTSTTTDGQQTMSTEPSSPSTTTFSTTIIPTTTLLFPTSSEDSTTRATNVVHIMSVPGTTRISKAQTTTTAEPDIVPSSTIQSSTDTIPPTLGEILNGRTVDALNNLLTNAEVSATKAPNFKTLHVNQNSITSSTTPQSTSTEVAKENDAPFTSPTIRLESTTQFPSSSDRLLSSTLISTLMPISTTTESPTTRKIVITSTTPTTTTTTRKITTPEIRTTTTSLTTKLPQVKTTVGSRATTGFPTLFPTILTTLFPNLLSAVESTPGYRLSSTRKPPSDAEIFNTIGDRFEVLSAAGSTARPTTVLPLSTTSQKISTTTPVLTTTRSTTQATTTTQRPTTTKAAQTSSPAPKKREDTEALFEELKKSGKLKDLNEEQRKNLEEIEKIEKEQAELLKQLSLLAIPTRLPFPSSTTRKTIPTTTIHATPTTTESVLTTLRFNKSVGPKSDSGDETKALIDQLKNDESLKNITEARRKKLNEIEIAKKQRSELSRQLNFLKLLGTLQFSNNSLIPTNLETTIPFATTTPKTIITTPTESTSTINIVTLATTPKTIITTPTEFTTIRDIVTLASKIKTNEESEELFEKLKKSKSFINIYEEQRARLAKLDKIEKQQEKLLMQLSLVATLVEMANSQTLPRQKNTTILQTTTPFIKALKPTSTESVITTVGVETQSPTTLPITSTPFTTIPIVTTTLKPQFIVSTPRPVFTTIRVEEDQYSDINIKKDDEETRGDKKIRFLSKEQQAHLDRIDKIEKQQNKLLMQLNLLNSLVIPQSSTVLPKTTILKTTTPFTILPLNPSSATPSIIKVGVRPKTKTREDTEELFKALKEGYKQLTEEQQAKLDRLNNIANQQIELSNKLNLLKILGMPLSSTILPISTTHETTTFSTTSTLKPSSTVVPSVIGVGVSKSVVQKTKTRNVTEELFDELKRGDKLKQLNAEQRAKLDKLNIIENQQKELLNQLNLLKISSMPLSSNILPITPQPTLQPTTPIITTTPQSINSTKPAFFPGGDKSKTREETLELFNQLKQGKRFKKDQQASLDKIAFFENQQVELLQQLNSLKILAKSARVLQQSSTTLPTTTSSQTTSSPTSTTTIKLTTTSKSASTTISLSKLGSPTPKTPEETEKLFEQLKKSGKLKNLSEEQRKNLEEIEKIEKEQAELLRQLTLLTTMFGGAGGRAANLPSLPNLNIPAGGSSNSLANRIIAMAMERDKSRSSPTTLTPTTKKPTTKPATKRPNSIQDQLPVSKVEGSTERTTPSLEDVLRQYNLSGLSTPAPLTSTYGKTDEALLAAILKEQGIGPTTPKVLGDKVKEAGFFEENSATKAPKPKPKPKPRVTTTTARPIGGRLMQGLNWLLDILDPPTTKRPAPKRPKPKPQPTQQTGGDEELLTNQPTRITPVVTAAPPVTKPNLSQDEIQALIKQLEAAQQDPNAIDHLDFSKIKNLQNLLNVNEGVQVTSAGQNGATLRATPRPQKIRSTTDKDQFLQQVNTKPKASTVPTLSVSNSIDEDVELVKTTTKPRALPPVSLNPIPGIDNQGDSLIRSNLLTAAVNVTRAISSFLGSAFQDAASQVRNMFTSGSALTNISGGSSVPGISSFSGDTGGRSRTT